MTELMPDLEKQLPTEEKERTRAPASLLLSPTGSTDKGVLSAPSAPPAPHYRTDSHGNLITHDALLNSSPLSLLKFVAHHCSTPPTPSIRARGHHMETRIETYTENITDSNGNVRRVTRERRVQVEIEDFSFTTKLEHEVNAGFGYAVGGGVARGVVYEMGDWEVAYRGERKKTKGGKELGLEVEVDREERRRLEAEESDRIEKGLPSFVHPASLVEISSEVLPPGVAPPQSSTPSSQPARLHDGYFVDFVEDHSIAPYALQPSWERYAPLLQARDERRSEVEKVVRDYCASTKVLKELVITKQTYGWNWNTLEKAIESTIRSTGYPNVITVERDTTYAKIIVRANNPFEKIFSLEWYWKALLWLVLVYPILLLIELAFGARFSSLRVAFPLARWRPLPAPYAGAPQPQNIDEASTIAGPLSGGFRTPYVAQLPTDGTWLYLVGVREGEWLASREMAIRELVIRNAHGEDL